jgi:excisionase family DNA binding protein
MPLSNINEAGKASVDPPKDWFSVDEVADLLGVNRKTLYDCIQRGEVPVVRLGRIFRIPGSWLKQVEEISSLP